MQPTLGYPSKSAAIIGLRREGLTEREISVKLGIKPNTVTSMECRARQREKALLKIDRNIYEDLRRVAWKRGITPEILGAKLLTVIVADGLIDAILDD